MGNIEKGREIKAKGKFFVPDSMISDDEEGRKKSELEEANFRKYAEQ